MSALKRVVRGAVICVGVATLVASAMVLAARWGAVADSVTGIDFRWLAAGSILLVACFGVLGGSWLLLVLALGGNLRSREAFRAFSLSQLPKYVPGRIAGHGVRVAVTTRAGVPLSVAIASVALEGALGLAGALVVAVLGTLVGSEVVSANAGRWLLLAFTVLVAIAGLVTLSRSSGAHWRTRLGLPKLRVQSGRLAVLSLAYVAVWFPIGGAYWLLANAITPLSGSFFFPMTVAVAVATGLGHIAIFAPGGIGVREAALYLFSSAWMADSDALAFVALTRFVAIVIESLLTAAGGLYSLRVRPASPLPFDG